jgi:hypothetical protein
LTAAEISSARPVHCIGADQEEIGTPAFEALGSIDHQRGSFGPFAASISPKSNDHIRQRPDRSPPSRERIVWLMMR